MLETEIKRLTENIAHLNKLLEVMAETAKGQVAHTVESEQETPVAENEGYTTDDIKSMALAITRKDRSKKSDIKEKLAEYDAKLATDLSGSAIQEVGEWLSAMKEEMGA